MAGKIVLSIGQCNMDSSSISSLLVSRFQAGVETADTLASALATAQQKCFDLILVNRVFDQTGEFGLEFIRQYMEKSGKTVPVMLVSNLSEAQDQAIQLGAQPGFGKGALEALSTRKLLEPFLA